MITDERSVLVTPASNPRMIANALASAADVVVLDLEDAVAVDRKVAARSKVIRAARELDWRGRPKLYRVNGLETPYFYRDLIDVVEAAGDAIDGVVLPKVERPEDVYVAETLLRQIEIGVGLTRRLELEVQIETASGLQNCDAIAAASPRVRALVFGPGDYAASVGMPAAAIGVADRWDAAYPGHRFHDTMHRILVAGRAAGARVIDGPFAAVGDLDGLRRSSATARALGYDGKWCIHPAQIDVVNDVFSPSQEEIAWAEKVVAAAAEAAKSGQGAISVDGVMVDGASVRLARATIAGGRRTSVAKAPGASAAS